MAANPFANLGSFVPFGQTLNLNATPPFLREVEGPPPSTQIEFQSITSLAEYRGLSFEQLRLNSYLSHPRLFGQPEVRFGRTKIFPLPRDGLVTVSIGERSYTAPSLLRFDMPQRIRYGHSVVTFRVGAEAPQSFTIHETLILPRSPFVRTALSNENWKEARERTIPLPDELPHVFELYQQWTYRGSVFSDPFRRVKGEDKEYETLVRAYLLGEKFIDPVFKDAVMDCIVDKLFFAKTFDLRLTSLVYDGTPPNSPLRRLWKDVFTWCGNASWLEESVVGEPIHPDFAVELNQLQLSFWNGQRPKDPPFMQNNDSYLENPCVVAHGTYEIHHTSSRSVITPIRRFTRASLDDV